MKGGYDKTYPRETTKRIKLKWGIIIEKGK